MLSSSRSRFVGRGRSSAGRARLGQRFELGVGQQHRLRGVVLGDRDRAAERGLLEDRAELVLEAGGGDGRDVDQLAVAVAESQCGHAPILAYGRNGHLAIY